VIPHHLLVGAQEAPHLALVLHGALGAGHNLRSLFKRLAAERPDYRFALVDLRCHGRSLGAPGPHTLERCADDLEELADALDVLPRAVIGHSLGGKVALCFGRRALSRADSRAAGLSEVWALDSDPGASLPAESHQVLAVLAALGQRPGPFRDRADATAALLSEGLDEKLAAWLVTSLARAPGAAGYAWQFDLPGVSELAADYFSLDLWPLLEEAAARPDSGGPRYELLVAERSDRWSGDMRERATALPPGGKVHLHVLADAGHWVHVDNPGGLVSLLAAHLR
jgi:pimeloyl-ACP methyl ester carboxylesterase